MFQRKGDVPEHESEHVERRRVTCRRVLVRDAGVVPGQERPPVGDSGLSATFFVNELLSN
jgi:hypothetical protein